MYKRNLRDEALNTLRSHPTVIQLREWPELEKLKPRHQAIVCTDATGNDLLLYTKTGYLIPEHGDGEYAVLKVSKSSSANKMRDIYHLIVNQNEGFVVPFNVAKEIIHIGH
jgi:hypothetical protein